MRRLASGALLCLTLTGCPVTEVYSPDFAGSGPLADLAPPPPDQAQAPSDMAGVADMTTPAAWKSEAPMGLSTSLRALTVVGADTYVVGAAGTVLRRGADNTWKTETVPQVNNQPVDLYGVVGLASGDVLGVGSTVAGGAVLRRSAGAWAVEQNVGATFTLYGVARNAAGDQAIAVGDKGQIVALSGGTWKAETVTPVLTSLVLRAVVFRGTDAWAVGDYNKAGSTTGVILKRGAMGAWDQDPGTIADADRVSFTAAAVVSGTVYVAGRGAKVLRGDAAGWVAEKTVLPVVPDGGAAMPATDFNALLGADDGTIVAAGAGGAVQVRSGGTWSADPLNASRPDIYALSGAWPRNLLAAGAMGYLARRN